ncbi:alpha/beta fold hydrolase [Legionella dresdenensis]|uniref:Alpha/beta fold hydrolase n=1 Tax=Legionella dresdenensis TaxID=450200 RepID=A0ABV8CF68_9GAMM
MPGKIRINDIDIYYEIHGKGNGNPLVLIAGFSCDHTFWTGVLGDLSRSHEVILFDNRGIGQTDAPDTPYSIDLMADDVMALITRFELDKPVIVGQSMGSAIAQNMARRFGRDLSKIVLINTFHSINKAPEMAFEFAGELQRSNASLNFRVQSIAPWVFSSEFLARPGQFDNLIKLTRDNPYPQTYVGYCRQLDALKGFNSRDWLHEIEVPALVIAAEEDIVSPVAGAREVVNGIGNQTRLAIIPGGHASPVEQPQKVSQTILNFVHGA